MNRSPRNASARAVYFTGPGEVSVEDVEVTCGADQILVTSTLIGISHGTEMLFYRGPFPVGQEMETLAETAAATCYPIKYGYINVGVTEAGERVFAFYPHQSQFSLRESDLIKLPDDLSDEDALFFASMETALQITHDCAPRLAEWVLVAGVGIIGTLVCLLLQRAGACVLAADPNGARRARLEKLGITTADPGAGEVAASIRELTGGGPDHAINTSANESALQLAVDSLRPQGTVIEASWYGSKKSVLSLGGAFHRRRLTIRSSQVSHLNPSMRPRWDRERRARTVIGLLRELNPSQFISHRIPLERAATAYRLIDEGGDDVFQAVLVP